MDDCIQQFNLLMQNLARQNSAVQELLCKTMQFTLEDYVKRFPPYAVKVYKDVFGMLDREALFSATDKTIVEIGPGFSVGVLFLAGLSGARAVSAVDAYPHDRASDHDYIASMYNHLLQDRACFFTDVKKLNDAEFTDLFARFITKDDQGRFSYRKERLEFHYPYFVENLPFGDASFDVGLRGRVVQSPVEDHGVEGSVELAVAAAAEPVPGRLA